MAIIHRAVKANPALAKKTTPESLHRKIETVLLGPSAKLKFGGSTFVELISSSSFPRKKLRTLLVEKFGSEEKVYSFLTTLIDQIEKVSEGKRVWFISKLIAKREGISQKFVRDYLQHHFGNSVMPLSIELQLLRDSLKK